MERSVKELLVLKSEGGYVRVLQNGFETCRLDKASVFPMGQLELVRSHGRSLRRAGHSNVEIYKLTIMEEKLQDVD